MSNAHKLKRLIRDKVDNQPLLITESNLKSVVDYLETRELSSEGDSIQENENILTDNIAVIPIKGNLTYEKTFLGALCGMTSYQQLLEDVDSALSMGMKTIVFMANSGGGEAYAMMGTANAIRKRVDEHGAKLISYVDGISASACFGLTAISDEIILHPDASIGSVGVVVRLVNDKEFQNKQGYKTTYITSAKSKVPFDEDGEFKESFLTDIKEKVDSLHTQFATHIADYRKMSLGDVNNTEAKVFDSGKAISLGFADKIMDHDQFNSYLADIEENMFSQKANLNLNINEEKEKMQLEEMQKNLDASIVEKDEALSQLSASNEQLANLQEQLVSMQAEKETLEASVAELNQDKQDKELSSRKEQLSAVLATDKVDSVFAAVSGLDQTSFDAIVASYAANKTQLNSSELFQEVGVSAEGELPEDMNAQASVLALIKSKKAK